MYAKSVKIMSCTVEMSVEKIFTCYITNVDWVFKY